MILDKHHLLTNKSGKISLRLNHIENGKTLLLEQSFSRITFNALALACKPSKKVPICLKTLISAIGGKILFEANKFY